MQVCAMRVLASLRYQSVRMIMPMHLCIYKMETYDQCQGAELSYAQRWGISCCAAEMLMRRATGKGIRTHNQREEIKREDDQ